MLLKMSCTAGLSSSGTYLLINAKKKKKMKKKKKKKNAYCFFGKAVPPLPFPKLSAHSIRDSYANPAA